MTPIPFLDLKTQYAAHREELLAAIEDVCQSTRFSQGPPVQELEKEFQVICNTRHCITVNSGTSALHLAMRCLDIGPGDEVVTAAFSFIATAWAISYVGATPVFVDIHPARRTLDPEKLEAAITPRTKAIIPVHLFGMPADLTGILDIANRYNIPVVEDAAQAHGARLEGRRVGEFGVMGCFSFYPGKNLGAYGEGGALVTNDGRLAARAKSLREHAQTQRYHHDEIGYNYRMDSIQAAVLRIKLRHLDRWNSERTRRATLYTELLHSSAYRVPAEFKDSECVWHLYVIESEDRDAVRSRLAEEGIESGLHYPLPLHLQKAYASLGYKPGDFPVAENLSKRCLSLPMYPEIPESSVRAVATAMKSIKP